MSRSVGGVCFTLEKLCNLRLGWFGTTILETALNALMNLRAIFTCPKNWVEIGDDKERVEDEIFKEFGRGIVDSGMKI